MSRFQPGDVALFMVAMDPRMIVMQGQAVRIVREGIEAGDVLGLDADGTQVRAEIAFDYVVDLQGGLWRGLCHDWQLAPLEGPPNPPGRIPEPV